MTDAKPEDMRKKYPINWIHLPDNGSDPIQDLDPIRAAAEEMGDRLYFMYDPELGWDADEAFSLIEQAIRREVERERERCIDEMKPYISETFWEELANRIRQGG
jgi:hypothetical protein